MDNIRGKKVLHIITLFSVGGATENTILTVAGLLKKGYKVDVITGPNISSEGSMYEIARKLGVNVLTFNSLKREISILNDFKIIYQLFKFIKNRNYDIVHTHSSKAGVVGRISAWLAGTKIIIHHNHANPYHRFQKLYIQKIYKLIERFSAFFCDKIASVTHTIVDEMVRDKIAKRDKFIVIRSGFDVDIFKYYNGQYDSELRNKFGINENEIVIGKIARLSDIKGHIYLLKAFKNVCEKVSNVKLLLIGDGENKKNLEKYIFENNLNEKVIFSGLIDPEKIPSVISLTNLIAHTALLEGLPRVFTQSMLMGKPIVAFNLDGAHEVIEDGKNGYLIEPMNIQMLSERLIELTRNPEIAKKFGEFAKNNIKEDFTIEAMVENNHKLYLDLLNFKGMI